MTHPYQDLKEAAEKVIEVRSTYIMSQSSDVSRDWGEALAEFRRIANPARILSLIEENERLREALEAVCSAVESSGTLTDRWSRTLNAVISARAALKEKQP